MIISMFPLVLQEGLFIGERGIRVGLSYHDCLLSRVQLRLKLGHGLVLWCRVGELRKAKNLKRLGLM